MRDYAELTRLQMEELDRENTMVLIPVAALEQHGNQLPLGTDDIIAQSLVDYLKKELPEDFPLLYFPLLPVGLSTEHLNFCGSVSLRPDTLYHVLYDICEGLAHHGFKKIVMLVSHGGNAPIIQVLSRQLRAEKGLGVCILQSFFNNPDVKATVSDGNVWDFHGGEMETSMVMASHPELVDLSVSVPGEPLKFEGNKIFSVFGSACVNWVAEDWTDASGSPIGIGGDPRGATAEKGKIILRSFARSMAQALREINGWDYTVTPVRPAGGAEKA